MNLLQERDSFRKSQTWYDFKQNLKQTQTLDFVTQQPLQVDCDCHHLDLNFENYSILKPSNFVLLNKDTHKKIHDICTIDWEKNLETYKGTVSDQEYNRMEILVKKMVTISGHEALFMFSYVTDYEFFDPSDDYMIASFAKDYHMPVAPSRNGKADQIQWYCFSQEAMKANLGVFPTDTREYINYVIGMNDNALDVKDIYIIAQLRHIGLRNSYKQINRLISKNPKNNNLISIRGLLETEIPTTTRYVRALKKKYYMEYWRNFLNNI